MGEIVSFESNGKQAEGYLAVPDQEGPGIVVIQEWWGLVDHIRDVCERLAGEGFVALAPDLFHGETTTEPDEASKMMMALEMDRAAKDMSGAAGFLKGSDATTGKTGCVGFCMGGALSLYLATIAPIDACVVFYGIPQPEPDYSKISGVVLGHFAEHDDWGSPKAAEELFGKLKENGIDSTLQVYEGTEHAFFNDDRPEVYNPEAAKTAWERTLEFFRSNLS